MANGLVFNIPSSASTITYWAVGYDTGYSYKYDSSLDYLDVSIDLISKYNEFGTIHWGTSKPRDIAKDTVNNKWVIVDIGYSQRIYILDDDWTYESFFAVNGQDTDPESVEVFDGDIYMGGGNRFVYRYSGGVYQDSIDLTTQMTDVSSQITGLRCENEIWYVLDNFSDYVYIYDLNWDYITSYTTKYDGTEGVGQYGLTKTTEGNWVMCDIDDDRFDIYDETFTHLSSKAQTQDDVISGIEIVKG